ncbi:MAG: NADH dehydrogenase (quinone) subunit D [marine benthic group bacterium]|nr:NADH dehydrogenase (quinone) subunit D [Gemmatimonadota bacterium]MCL7964362.1 NADH dehydrogenase (quinone) subunit D [Gemmatimonadota bacterium]MCL7967947.1 NADH dehydrogenase (quinone) subunit D [Gemmatimonadota bacterium]MCL7969346.1 NADH dehydrogenase (quinone) subunit D [Gemmatimonadota bacterium]MCL7973698.1 NADH dehydrogenase (quinone) subunit D [Gemmatimonadota bacterium]
MSSTTVPEQTIDLITGTPPAEGGADTDPAIQALRRRFDSAILSVHTDAVDVPCAVIDPASNYDVLEFLKTDPAMAYDLLVDVMGVDIGGGRPIRVWYQLWSMRHGRQLRIECRVPYENLELRSVTPLWRTANWLEREVWDMYGVTFTGHPDLRRILMPENYDEGFPLRKEFPLRGRFARSEQVRRALERKGEEIYAREELEMAGVLAATEEDAPSDELIPELSMKIGPELLADGLEADRMVINMGPQHPATHGVLRLVLQLDGENVERCIPHIGYLHTGFEKTCEYREWNQVVPYTDRMDYLAPMIYNIAYAGAVESLLGIEITPRCRAVRLILSELNRLLGHLLWLGTTAMDIGATTVFIYTFGERETIYNLHEAYCGSRITNSATRIGGMLADLPAGWLEACRDFVRRLPETLDESERLLTRNSIWMARTMDIGVIDAETALNFGLTGPNLRASGIAYDVRKARPYLGYDEYDFDVPVGVTGDTYDRYLVRLEEMRQSIRILEQALDRVPDGPINVSDPAVILPPKSEAMGSIDAMIAHFKLVMEGLQVPAGEVWYSVEATKGELGIGIVSDGGSKPVRCRFRAPSFVNLSALPYLVEGGLVSDVIAVNASIDIVLGEIDR